MFGVLPGRRWKSAKGISRSPLGPCTRTTASSAARATHMSEGWVAMHSLLVPSTPQTRFCPLMAGHPLPGWRLLHAISTS